MFVYTSSPSHTVSNETHWSSSAPSPSFHVLQQPVSVQRYSSPINIPSQRVTSTLSRDQKFQPNAHAPTYFQASDNILQQVSVVEEYSGRVHKFLPSVTQTHSQFQVVQPNAPTYSEPLEYQQDFSVQQGHSRYSSLAHALSGNVTPTHSPDQVGQSNASAYPQPSPHLRQDTFPVQDASPVHIASQSVSLALSQNPATKIKAHTPDKPHACPNCKKKFQRRQELMRHLLSNLPHWILCPFPRCPWVGNRRWNLKVHLKAHPKFDHGREPEPEETQIYDPEEFVESMARGTLTVASAADTALSMIKKRFAEPDKAGVEAKVWSSRRKICTERRRS